MRYNSYGVSASGTVSGTTVSISSDAHYLEIPILVKPTFNAGGWYPYLVAGPMVGFKVSESASATAGSASASASTSIYKTINFAMDFGAGAEVPIAGAVRAFLQFDYNLGLVNVVSASGAGTADTRGAVLTAGVAMPF